MVKIDLAAIKEDISSWTNDKLISEAEINIDDYTETVKSILKDELKKRNISPELISERVIEHKSKSKQLEKIILTGIRGWLLLFLIIQILNSLVILLSLTIAVSKSNLIVFVLLSLILLSLISQIILVLSKKKIAIKIIKIILSIFIVISLLSLVGAVIKHNSVIASLIIFSGSIAWFFYFNKSIRVKYTFTK